MWLVIPSGRLGGKFLNTFLFLQSHIAQIKVYNIIVQIKSFTPVKPNEFPHLNKFAKSRSEELGTLSHLSKPAKIDFENVQSQNKCSADSIHHYIRDINPKSVKRLFWPD